MNFVKIDVGSGLNDGSGINRSRHTSDRRPMLEATYLLGASRRFHERERARARARWFSFSSPLSAVGRIALFLISNNRANATRLARSFRNVFQLAREYRPADGIMTDGPIFPPLISSRTALRACPRCGMRSRDSGILQKFAVNAQRKRIGAGTHAFVRDLNMTVI